MCVFFDATCTKCRRRYGWTGTYLTKPPVCPYCGSAGHQPALESDMEMIRQARELFHEYKTATPGPTRKNQRIAAGLTVGQAAPRLDLTPEVLKAVEDGSVACTEELAAKMNKVYGITLPE